MFTKKTQLFALNVEANMITNLTPTEIESLCIAIAEECGWKFKTQPFGDPYWAHPEINRFFDEPPFYTTSLDAIQAAAMERFKDNRWDFENHLLDLADEIKEWDTPLWQLSALDWCIAFARTAKIWRYKL